MVDHLFFHEFDQGGSEVQHAFFVALADDVKQLAFAGLEDVLLDGRRAEQDLECGDSWNVIMQRLQEFLIDDGPEVVCQQLDLLDFVLVKEVVDTAECLPGR